MYRLIVNPGTTAAWEIQLTPGINTLGRDPSNQFHINHESVSSFHCQIVVTGHSASIRDLGSSCGTFINHEQVKEESLLPGQTINLGEVELLLSSDTGSGTEAPGHVPVPPVPRRIPTQDPIRVPATACSSPPTVSVDPANCKHHPKAQAGWMCQQCQALYCDLCVTVRRFEGSVRHLCRVCGNECSPVSWQVRPAPPEKGFFAQLPRAFSYPFKGNGVFLLIGGTVFFLILGWLPIVGILLTGYLFNYAKSIVASTAGGKAEPPDWPDFSDWKEDVLLPYGQLIALVVLAFGPTIVLWWWHPGSETFARTAIFAAAGFGALLAPMGMLALAMFDTVAALNPVALVWSILRIPLHYLVAAATFELVVGINFIAEDWIGSLIPLPVLLSALSGFINLYLMTVGMRILGLLYQADRERLGWF